MSRVTLSLIFPVYNGEAFLQSTLATSYAFLKTLPYDWEWLIVDDCSRDQSRRIAESFLGAIQDARVHLVRCNRNGGKGAAVRLGIREAQGDYIMFIDCDLAYPISEVAKILSFLEAGADVAIACRVLRESTFVMSPAFFPYLYTRHLLGRIFNWIVRLTLLPRILDTQAGLKGFRRDAAQAIFALQTIDRFSFDVELLFIAQRLGLRVDQVPIVFRYFEEPTTVRFIRDSITMVRDLVQMRLNAVLGRYGPKRQPAAARNPVGGNQSALQ